jgi:hypothetical protein
MDFRHAKVFRRIRCSSFAVQLLDGDKFMPGIVQVHCNDVDWGHLFTEDLERRLCKMGTPASVFGEMQGVIECHEGVMVALGPYDAKMRGFVQCRLKVVPAMEEQRRKGEICVVCVPEVRKRKREEDVKCRRRVFKWHEFNKV